MQVEIPNDLFDLDYESGGNINQKEGQQQQHLTREDFTAMAIAELKKKNPNGAVNNKSTINNKLKGKNQR